MSASKRVEHERPRAQPGLQALGDRGRGGLADRAVGRVQLGEAGFERGGLAGELDGDRRDLLVEEPLPRAPSRDRLLVEHDFFRLAEKVRAVTARRSEEVRGERESVVGEQRVGLFVRELRPLELEEQQLGADRRAALVDLLHARAACRVGGVGGEVETDEASRAGR